MGQFHQHFAAASAPVDLYYFLWHKVKHNKLDAHSSFVNDLMVKLIGNS
jgi:hypothetical protein